MSGKQQTRKRSRNLSTLRVGEQFNLKPIIPKTDTQKDIFDSWEDGYHMVIMGPPGTGKTFIPFYLALKDILEHDKYRYLTIFRSSVPTRNEGFLPGNEEEKISAYETPYIDAGNAIFGRSDAYGLLKKRGIIKFQSTSYNRGVSLDNSIIMIDEAQNMSNMELHTLTTRVGENSKIIFCGDVNQDDLTSERFKEYSGFADHIRIMETMDCVDVIEFGVDDIVRSDFVKSYIIQRISLTK